MKSACTDIRWDTRANGSEGLPLTPSGEAEQLMELADSKEHDTVSAHDNLSFHLLGCCCTGADASELSDARAPAVSDLSERRGSCERGKEVAGFTIH